MKGIIQSAMSAIIVAMVMFGCSSEKQVKSKKDLSLPLNITIYLDLSDRLVRDLTPSQRERDLAIVEHFTKLFQDSCQSTGIFKSKHRLKVLFYPAPENTEINTLASALVIDMKNLPAKDKRVELQKMPSVFKNSLAQIYDETLNAKKWLGSDIWGFFSNKKVDDLCIKKGYRNVLVILTDGYLYYELNYKIPCSGVISRPAASTSCRSFFITSAGIHLRSTLTVRTRLRLRTMSIGA